MINMAILIVNSVCVHSKLWRIDSVFIVENISLNPRYALILCQDIPSTYLIVNSKKHIFTESKNN
jgi:hypothetical protein